jgi:hypothetical protein
MGVINHLSSQMGDKSPKSNIKVIAQCKRNPDLLDEVVGSLRSQDKALAGDCAEVLTEIAKQRPELIAPYAQKLSPLLSHQATRVRWEAMHALALIATSNPKIIARLLPRLIDLVRTDSSVIVRDYAVDAMSNYAKTGKKAARATRPLLIEALTIWNGKHAARAIIGLINVVTVIPKLREELHEIGVQYSSQGRDVVRRAAKALTKATEDT